MKRIGQQGRVLRAINRAYRMGMRPHEETVRRWLTDRFPDPSHRSRVFNRLFEFDFRFCPLCSRLEKWRDKEGFADLLVKCSNEICRRVGNQHQRTPTPRRSGATLAKAITTTIRKVANEQSRT